MTIIMDMDNIYHAQSEKKRPFSIAEKKLTIVKLALNSGYIFLAEAGDIARFSSRFIRDSLKRHPEFEEFVRQCFWVGYKSLPLVVITAFIMGLALTIQSRPTLVEFGAEPLLPSITICLIFSKTRVVTCN